MTWHWRLEDPSGASVDPAALGVEPPGVDNQGDAESWLGENWRDLLAKGVATVSLFDRDGEVYGPRGLAAPGRRAPRPRPRRPGVCWPSPGVPRLRRGQERACLSRGRAWPGHASPRARGPPP